MVAHIVLLAAAPATHIEIAHKAAVVRTVAADILQVVALKVPGQVAVLHRQPRVVKRVAYRWYRVGRVSRMSKWRCLGAQKKERNV